MPGGHSSLIPSGGILGKRNFLGASPARITQGSESELGIFLLTAPESFQALGNSFGVAPRLSWAHRERSSWDEQSQQDGNWSNRKVEEGWEHI